MAMARSSLVAMGLACVVSAAPTMRSDDPDDRCEFYDSGTIPASADMPGSLGEDVLGKEEYYRELKSLDIKELYDELAGLMKKSQSCWPADGPQDGDIPNYAGLFGRLAWHCSGSFRLIDNKGTAAGGCEGARQRHWPENEWRDNANLDKARALLGQIKEKFGNKISWGDLMTFAGTVGIKASGGPAKRFCFGRVDDIDGRRSVQFGVQGTNSCGPNSCRTDAPCKQSWLWPEQDESDPKRCNLTQHNFRLQASHSVGLIYVYPEGPQLKSIHPEFDPKKVHNRSPRLSALEVRDTFKNRMGWTDRETVALIGGGHTLGRTHGNCNLTGTKWAALPYNGEGPYFEAVPGSGSGPTDGTCGKGALAGKGPNTVTSGFDGAWTRTPSRWNYDYFTGLVQEAWAPVKSPFGNDQWWTKDRSSKFAKTRRLTADMSLMADETYKQVALEYVQDHAKFDSDFADAWFKLMHRSGDHPQPDDLEKDAGVCTTFDFLTEAIEV